MFFFGSQSYIGFKLISLELKNDKVFGDIIYDFVEVGDLQNEIYTTVIIGSNGTRKSLLFKRIITLFWDLNTLKNEPKKRIKYPFSFSLKYAIDNSIYEYANIHKSENDKDTYLKINNELEKVDNLDFTFDKVLIPDTIVANAIMITDKFPFPNQEQFPQYKYLGSRYRPQLASTSSYITRTVDFIANSINNKNFLEGINTVIKEFFSAEFDPYIIFYTQNTPFFFGKDLNIGTFSKFFEDINIKYSTKTTTPPFKLNYYKSKIKNNDELISRIVEFCKILRESDRLRGFPRTSKKAISFKLTSESDLETLKKEIEILNHLKSLGIVYAPQIEFLKFTETNNKQVLDGYSIFDSSSGEHNLLGSMVGLMATVKPNSLIFIDEPEVSLHPNWQMKYLNIIRRLFASELYAKSHIIVATHSHFIVSDLKGENSKIIGLTRTPNLQVLPLPKNINTFGWSAEDVLYNVFNVATTRNFYVAKEIGEILKIISKKDIDFKILNNKKDELEKIKQNLKMGDPLKSLIEKVQKEFLNA